MNYKIIFIERDLDEVLASQQVMLERNNRAGAKIAPERLKATFEKQLTRIRAWIDHQPHADVLYVRHRDVIDDPYQAADQVKSFLGEDLDVNAMAKVVDPDMHHHRSPVE